MYPRPLEVQLTTHGLRQWKPDPNYPCVTEFPSFYAGFRSLISLRWILDLSYVSMYVHPVFVLAFLFLVNPLLSQPGRGLGENRFLILLAPRRAIEVGWCPASDLPRPFYIHLSDESTWIPTS